VSARRELAKQHFLNQQSNQPLRAGAGDALYPPNVVSIAGADDANDEKDQTHLEELNMKKLIPFVGLAALALTVLDVKSTHALLGLFDPPGGGGSAPEIDPSSIGSAIALVMGGSAMVADRFRR